MTAFLSPSLLQALKDFDSSAPEAIMTRAEEIQNKGIIDKDAFKKGFLAPFRPAVLKALFTTLVNPAGGSQDLRNAMELSTFEENREKARSCWQQAVNEYINESGFPRHSLDIEDLVWLYENPSQILDAKGRQPRI